MVAPNDSGHDLQYNDEETSTERSNLCCQKNENKDV